MPKNVEENRTKVSMWVAITTAVMCAIPIIIIAIVAAKHPGTWGLPFPQFMLYFSIECAFFALIIGFLAQLNMVLWYILYGVGAAGTLALIITGYVLGSPVIIHLGSSALFMFMMYFIGKDTNDNIYFRYTAPLFCIIAALISILLCTGVHMSLTGHIIMAAICEAIILIPTIISVVNFFKEKNRSYVLDKRLSYSMETEQEKTARKAKKYQESKRKEKEAQENKAIKKGFFTDEGEPDVEAMKADKEAKAKKRKEKRKSRWRFVGGVLGGIGQMINPWAPPLGSEEWDIYDWAKYIKDKVESKARSNYGTFYADFSTSSKEIEIIAHFSPYSDTSTNDYNTVIKWAKEAFHSACKHCPFSATMNWR